MNYQNLDMYKALIFFGCTESTGPIMRKKGIVQLDLPHNKTSSQPHYHFDPKYQINGSLYEKASRKQMSAETIFFIKPSKENSDYELAFLYFFLHLSGAKNINYDFNLSLNEIVNNNKLRIFNFLFNRKGD